MPSPTTCCQCPGRPGRPAGGCKTSSINSVSTQCQLSTSKFLVSSNLKCRKVTILSNSTRKINFWLSLRLALKALLFKADQGLELTTSSLRPIHAIQTHLILLRVLEPQASTRAK